MKLLKVFNVIEDKIPEHIRDKIRDIRDVGQDTYLEFHIENDKHMDCHEKEVVNYLKSAGAEDGDTVLVYWWW